MTNCSNADVARTAQDEENDRCDAQVDGDGEEDAGKNDACYHHAESTPEKDGDIDRSEVEGCVVLQLSAMKVSHASMDASEFRRKERQGA